MIDFIKIVIYDSKEIQNIWNNSLLDFYETKEKRVSVDEVRNYHKKTYLNLFFEKYYNRIEISGSIHTFKNDGIHNANQFSIIDSISTIYKIKELFSLDLTLCKIVNLEYGLNIIPKADIKNVIIWLKYHNKNEFRYFPGLKYAKQSATFKSNGKINKYKFIKAYAKGLQQFEGKLHGNLNTFRFEVKSKESKYIRSIGINTLADLTKHETYGRLCNELIKEWRNVLLLDMNLRSMNNGRLNTYLNTDFWENSINLYRNHFSKNKQKYLALLKQYPDNLFSHIEKLIQKKLTQFKKEKGCKFDKQKNNKKGQIRPYIELEYAPQCKLTGIDISMQRNDSFLLSHTGLKYYFHNNPKIYHLIKNKYLTKDWNNSGFQTQIEKIAHNIRCHYHNRMLKQEKIYKPNQYSMFVNIYNP